jgi:hypothetical protein
MPGAFYEQDLQHLFDPCELGTAATFVDGERAGYVVNGHKAAPYSGSFGAPSTLPEFTCRTCDLDGVRNGDMLELDDTVYRIDSREPTDTPGITRLMLAVAS